MSTGRYVNLLTASNYFFAGALSIIIPLLLIQRGIPVSEIGIILAILPVVFITLRLVFGLISDHIGFRPFLLSSSIFQGMTTMVYYFSSSVTFFILGKIFEGAQNAFIWSVNRQAVYKNGGEKAATNMIAYGSIASCLGRIFAGFMLAYLAFTNTLLVLSVLGFLMFIPANFVREKSKRSHFSKKSFRLLDFRTKDPQFKKIAFILVYSFVASALVFDFMLQIFLSEKGWDFESIGLGLAMFSLISGLVSLYTLKRPDMNKIILVQTASICGAFLIFPFLGGHVIWIVLALLAIGDGASKIIWEIVIVKATKSSKNKGTDIGLLFLPGHLSRAGALFISGFILQYFGYLPVFWFSALLILIFSYKIRQFL